MTASAPFIVLAKMQAHVLKLRGLVSSGNPNRKTLEVGETWMRSKSLTDWNSSVNWHWPGGTKTDVGLPVKEGAALLLKLDMTVSIGRMLREWEFRKVNVCLIKLENVWRGIAYRVFEGWMMAEASKEAIGEMLEMTWGRFSLTLCDDLRRD